MWVLNKSLLDKALKDPINRWEDATISIFGSYGNWNHDVLREWLPYDIVLTIQALQPSSELYGQDKLCQKEMINGTFIVKSAYKMITGGMGQETKHLIWKRIWEWQGLERMRYFLWKVCHQGLMTNEAKQKRGLGMGYCNQCPNILEMTIHALRDCKLAKNIQYLLIKLKFRSMFFTLELTKWLSLNGDLAFYFYKLESYFLLYFFLLL